MNISYNLSNNSSEEKRKEFANVFWMADMTTGIFCLETCIENKHKIENLEYFNSAITALGNGYRPCKICRPLQNVGQPSAGIAIVINEILRNPEGRLTEADLLEKGMNSVFVKSWFFMTYEMTFQEFQQHIRLNSAVKKLQSGENLIEKAYDSGFKIFGDLSDNFKKFFATSLKDSGEENILDVKKISTPLGTMYAAATKKGICMLQFTDRKALEREFSQLGKEHNALFMIGKNPHIDLLEKELSFYFKGELKNFSVSFDLVGTEFQKKVWEALLKIPFGELWTYKKQARYLGDEKKVRAVANANGVNKISIVIPCHRVIGSDGTLTGYGGGIWRKNKLLEIEKATFNR